MTPHKGFAKLELQCHKAITSTRMPGTSEEDLVLQLKRNQTQNEPDTKTEPDTKMPCCSTLRPVVLPSQCREIARKRASGREREKERERDLEQERKRKRKKQFFSGDRNSKLHPSQTSSIFAVQTGREKRKRERKRARERERAHTRNENSRTSTG